MKTTLSRTKGFYLSMIAALLSLASAIVYGGVTYINPSVYYVLIIAIVFEAVLTGLTFVKGVRKEYNIIIMINTVLIMLGAGLSAAPMANEIANTIAGLNEWSVLYTYFLYISLILLGWLLFLIASFTGIAAEKE